MSREIMSQNGTLLPSEAVALVQHIELNKAGWWDKAVQRLVLAAVWLSDEPPSLKAIQTSLESTFKLRVAEPKIESVLASLESAQMLLRLPTETYRIPDEHRAKFETEITASENAERAAKGYFFKLVEGLGENLEAEAVWSAFENEFLGPLIKQVGANAYRLIAGEKMSADKALVDRFLVRFSEKAHNKLRALVTAFLDPKKAEVCAYISRILHARFCVDASGLPGDVLAKLNASIGKNIRFQMFVDTNFLFSLIELHENPSNAAAQELRELIEHLKGSLRIEFVITPETINEAKRSIAYTKGQLNGMPAGNNFTQAAMQGNFSGMTVRFLKERQSKNGKLTTDDWFDPYLNNFVTMARGKGVELHNEKLDGYSTRDDVVDDINLVLKYEKRLPENRRKSYEKIQHDMVLWHFVNDKRPAYVESPTDANCWVLTVDYRLIGFDEHKQKRSQSKVPLCIHPTSLIQILRFWIPRSKDFEEAVLGSLRLPFLFQDFDVQAERTSLKILKGIGRFEGSEGLAQETITHVMLNDGLRSRLQNEQSEEAEVALIRDALVEEMRIRAKEEETKAKALEAEVLKRDTKLATLEAQNRAIEEEKSKTTKAKEEAEEAARRTHASQEKELNDLKVRLKSMEDAEKVRAEAEAQRQADAVKRGALLKYLGMLSAVLLFSGVSAWWLAQYVPKLNSLIGTAASRVLIAITVFVSAHLALELTVCRKEPMSQSWPFKQVRRFRGWLWSLVILGFVLGIVGNLVANRIQQKLDMQSPPPISPAPDPLEKP